MTTAAIKAEVLRDFKKLTPTKKVPFGNEVVSEMTLHPLVFPTPKIPLVDLALINNTLNAKNIAAATGDKEAIEDRDNYLPIWIDAFDQQADYVQGVANGNTTIIEQSGYHSSKTTITNSEVPEKLLIDAEPNKQHGSIHYKAAGSSGKHLSFLAIAVKEGQSLPGQGVQMEVNGDVLKITVNGTEVFIQPTTQRQGDFNNLSPRGAEVNVVMVAFNPAGISPVSEPVSVMVP
jgi:hypothetical protein